MSNKENGGIFRNKLEEDISIPSENPSLSKYKKSLEKKKQKEKKEPKTVLSNSKKTNNLVENKKDERKKIEPTSIVVILDEILKITSSSISMADSDEESQRMFKKFLNRQIKLKKVVKDYINVGSGKEYDSVSSDLGRVIADLVSQTFNVNNESLQKHFDFACKESINLENDWIGELKQNPMMSIRARIEVFKCGIKCWNFVNEYNFIEEENYVSKKMLDMILSHSRDFAKKWDENISSKDKQQIYVNIIETITNVTENQWKIFIIKKLKNDNSTYDTMKKTYKEEINEILENYKTEDNFSQSILEVASELTENAVSKHQHLPASIINRARKTYFCFVIDKLKDVILSSNDLNNLILEKIVHQLKEKIEEKKHESPLIVSVKEFEKFLFLNLANIWAASMGVFSFLNKG